MKKQMLYLFFAFSFLGVRGQSSSLEISEISLTAYIPEQTEYVPEYTKSLLKSKLNQMITESGVTGDVFDPRFIIAPKITVLTKDLTATAPSMTALNLEFTLFFGDGISGTLFSSKTFNLKGVGTNENKAYMNAVRKLNPNRRDIQNFIKEGKIKVLDYYNINCETIIKNAEAMASENKYKEALSILASIPKACSCYDNVQYSIRPIYTEMINLDCQKKLSEAKGIWGANQDFDSANKAAGVLATIEPNASCFDEVKDFYQKIERKVLVKQYLDRQLYYKLKVLDLKRTAIQAARDVNVAYYNNRRRYIIYKIRRWYY